MQPILWQRVYRKRVSVLPPSYRRISHGDEVVIGTRRFKVITGGGHAVDQVMLYCADDKLFLSADQVLSKISPNVSVWAVEPEQNSLGEYLASLASLTTTLPYDVLVLPGHGVPFYGLKTRIKQLADHLGGALATISAWELGKRFPSARHFEMLMSYTGVPPCRLFCVMADKCVPVECLLAMPQQP